MFGENIDYVVRSRIRDRRKADIWLKDQYYNPHETWHSVDEVLEWFDENGVSYLNSVPHIIGAGARKRHDLFSAAGLGSTISRVLTQVTWLGSIASEGALFVMVGRKKTS